MQDHQGLGQRPAEKSKDYRGTADQNPTAIKRKAVPPGYLQGALLARQRLNSVGLRAPTATEDRNHPNRLPANSQNLSGRGVVIPKGFSAARLVRFAPNTLPQIFAHRKKYLQGKRRKLKTPYQERPGQPIGLLSMPEDVLLRIVCFLDHKEIKPLFQVCKPLAHTLNEAIRFHFNYATPSRHASHQPQPQQSIEIHPPEKNKRPGVTNLQAVMEHLRAKKSGPGGPSGSSAAAQNATRVLQFSSAQNTPCRD